VVQGVVKVTEETEGTERGDFSPHKSFFHVSINNREGIYKTKDRRYRCPENEKEGAKQNGRQQSCHDFEEPKAAGV
jgi:hypothetical protein